MKLKTKLIPLASVAAVCATVAPITLTSCESNAFVDLVDGYTPSYDKLANDDGKTIMDEVEATNTMAAFFNEHPDYFKEEYYWSTSNMVQTLTRMSGIEIQADAALTKATMDGDTIIEDLTFNVSMDKITDLHLDTKSIKAKDSGGKKILSINVPVASFTLEYERVIKDYGYFPSMDANAQTPYAKDDIDVTMKGKQIYTNIPFVACQYTHINEAGPTLAWTIMPFIQLVSGQLENYLKKTQGAASVIDFGLEWTIDSTLEMTRKGVYSDPSGDFIIDQTNSMHYIFDESYLKASNMQIVPAKDVEFDTQMAMFVSSINTSYYLYNVGYKEGKISGLWN